MADDNALPEYQLWHGYTPSAVGGGIAAALFAILTIGHGWRLARTRLWFCIPFVVGGLFETIGYAARAAAHNDTEARGTYIIQAVLILLAPILFAASVYMTLTRMIRACKGEQLSVIRVKWVTKIFVGGDVLCFIIQAGGGGMLAAAKDKDAYDRGENIVLGGLILQIMVFTFFVVVAGLFHYRMRVNLASGGRLGFTHWQRYVCMLYVVSGLIAVRNICRCVEYSGGQDGYLVSHEFCLYLYDFLLMFLCLSACLVWYNLDMHKLLRPHSGTAEMLPTHRDESKYNGPAVNQGR